jgi:DNA polymerase
MYRVTLADETDFAGWRDAARLLAAAQVAPDRIVWTVEGRSDLLDALGAPLPRNGAPLTVPRRFVALAETVVLHRDPERFARLYRLLVRLGEAPRLLDLAIDPDVTRIEAMARAVRHDIHKMRAFVRFRRTALDDADWYVAWFEPEHHIVAANAPFFMRRFTAMNWSILTPRASAHWNGEALSIGPGGCQADAPGEDALEALWRGYYASIFNPARLKVQAMKGEMAVRYWRNLPEARLIVPLIAAAQQRTRTMVATGTTDANARPQRANKATPSAADAGTLDALKAEAADCRACPLWAPATQTVFGEGPIDAPVMFVGEQPGDREDLAGRPFVGPAGQLFDRALRDAGIDRARGYVTNAVKHFRFEPRGKRRIHQRPGTAEIRACRFWLDRELELVGPRLVVALGATAAQSIFGNAMPIRKNRGQLLRLDEQGCQGLVTVHPSYLLRLPDEAAKAAEYAKFVEDLRRAAPFFGPAPLPLNRPDRG